MGTSAAPAHPASAQPAIVTMLPSRRMAASSENFSTTSAPWWTRSLTSWSRS